MARSSRRFEAAKTLRKLDAIEKRLARRLRAINTRLYLWFLEYAALGIPPKKIPHWVSHLTADAIKECYRFAFSLGWGDADRATRIGHKARPREFAKKKPVTGYVEGNWMQVSLPGAGAVPAMSSFLVGGKLMADGTMSFPYPEEGLRWYADQAIKLAASADEAKLAAVRDVIQAGVEEGAGQRQMASYVAEALRPFGLQGGLGTEQAVPGAVGGLREVVDLPRWQMDRIVRTETMHIYNAGRYMRQVGEDIIIGWEWSAILDDVCCDECEERDGTFIPKGEEVGEMPPAHENCRCIAIEVLDVEQPPDQTLDDLSDDAQIKEGWGDPLRREWTAEEA